MNAKQTLVLLCLLSLAAPLFALSGSDAAKAYKEPSDRLNTTKLTVPSGTFMLASLNGEDALLLKDSDGSIISDENAIKAILTENIYAQADTDARVASIGSKFSAFNATREPGYSKCRQFTGTAMHPCIDRETCHRACLSNPNCALISDLRFIEAIQAWVVTSEKLESAISAFSSGIPSLKTGTSATASSQISKLDAVKSAVERYDGNGLTLPQSKTCETCYEVCAAVNLTAHPIDPIYSELNSLKTGLAPLDTVASRASSLKAVSDRETAYQASKKSKFSALSDKVANRKAELKSSAQKALGKIDSPSLNDSLTKLENITGDITYLGNKGDYRLALAKEAAFDSQASDLESLAIALDRKHSSLLATSKNLSQKIDAAYSVVGNGSASASQLNDAKAKLAKIDTRLKSQIKESDVPSIESDLKALSDEVKDILSAAALSGGARGGGSSDITKQLPPEVRKYCGLGIVLGALLLAAFAMRRKG